MKEQTLHAGRERGSRKLTITVGGVTTFSLAALCWVFKMNTSEGQVLPYSIFQLAVPWLGFFCLLGNYGKIWRGIRHLSFPEKVLLSGIICIMLGAFLHIGEGDTLVQSIMFAMRWGLIIAAYIIFTTLGVDQRYLRGLALGGAFGVFLNIAVIVLYKLGFDVPTVALAGGLRFDGLMNHPNDIGIALTTFSPLWMLYLISTRSGILAKAAVILLFVMLHYYSLSKTNILLSIGAMTATLVVVAYVRRWNVLRVVTMGLVVMGLVLAGFAVGLYSLREFSSTYVERMERAVMNPFESSTIQERFYRQEFAWNAIRSEPVTGIGITRSDQLMVGSHAHNGFLQLWMQEGLLGAFGVVFLFAGSLICGGIFTIKAYKLRREDVLLKAVCFIAAISYIAANQLSSSFGTATLAPFSVICGVALSILVPKVKRFKGSPTRRQYAGSHLSERYVRHAL